MDDPERRILQLELRLKEREARHDWNLLTFVVTAPFGISRRDNTSLA